MEWERNHIYTLYGSIKLAELLKSCRVCELGGNIKVGDSIKEVHCNVADTLSGNIMAHTLIDSFLICDIVIKFK